MRRLLVFPLLLAFAPFVPAEPEGAAALEEPAEREELVYLGLNDEGAEEWYRVQDGATVVRVPGGPYRRRPYEGGPATRESRPVEVASFFVDKHEVTNARFARFLNAVEDASGLVDVRVPGLERTKEGWRAARGLARHPVTAATGRGAAAYAKWVGGTIPTPAQWEKAAGGPDGLVYPWGDAAPDATRANFALDGELTGARPVGSFPAGASPYGVLDMAGNVYDRVLARGRPVMIKGGSWLSPHPLNLRVADLCMQPVAVAERSVGFRCVMADPEPDRPVREKRATPELKLARSWAAAVEEARRRRVPIFLSLQFDTCGQCDRTRAQLFRDPRFVAYCNRHLVVAVGHRAAPQPGVENHEEGDDGCPLYPGLDCVDHHEIFLKALPVVERFKVSPGNFVLHPDRIEQGRRAILVAEDALPKWGLAVQTYVDAFEKARARLR